MKRDRFLSGSTLLASHEGKQRKTNFWSSTLTLILMATIGFRCGQGYIVMKEKDICVYSTIIVVFICQWMLHETPTSPAVMESEQAISLFVNVGQPFSLCFLFCLCAGRVTFIYCIEILTHVKWVM